MTTTIFEAKPYDVHVTLIRAGDVRITTSGGEVRAVQVDEGFLSVDHNRVTVVVHAATDLGVGEKRH